MRKPTPVVSFWVALVVGGAGIIFASDQAFHKGIEAGRTEALEVQQADPREVPIKTEIGTYHYGDKFPVGGELVICTIVGGKGTTLTLECPFPELRPP